MRFQKRHFYHIAAAVGQDDVVGLEFAEDVVRDYFVGDGDALDDEVVDFGEQFFFGFVFGGCGVDFDDY